MFSHALKRPPDLDELFGKAGPAAPAKLGPVPVTGAPAVPHDSSPGIADAQPMKELFAHLQPEVAKFSPRPDEQPTVTGADTERGQAPETMTGDAFDVGMARWEWESRLADEAPLTDEDWDELRLAATTHPELMGQLDLDDDSLWELVNSGIESERRGGRENRDYGGAVDLLSAAAATGDPELASRLFVAGGARGWDPPPEELGQPGNSVGEGHDTASYNQALAGLLLTSPDEVTTLLREYDDGQGHSALQDYFVAIRDMSSHSERDAGVVETTGQYLGALDRSAEGFAAGPDAASNLGMVAGALDDSLYSLPEATDDGKSPELDLAMRLQPLAEGLAPSSAEISKLDLARWLRRAQDSSPELGAFGAIGAQNLPESDDARLLYRNAYR